MIKNLIVITSYPKKGIVHGEGTVGIASYTKNTLVAMKKVADEKNEQLNIKVVAEKLSDKRDVYFEDGMEIHRIWQRNDPFTFIKLLLFIIRESKSKKVLIEFEHAMFGNYLYFAFFPLFLYLLKCLDKEVIIVFQQVINDIDDLSGHINLKQRSLKSRIINRFVEQFYKESLKYSDKAIVFEHYLKDVLVKKTGHKYVEKIAVIPHGVELPKGSITKEKARKKLGMNDKFIILNFGFIAWYKGTDWIVDAVKNQETRIMGKRVKLIIAGGLNPNHMDKPFYMDYFKKIDQTARNSDGKIDITGFVSEKDISLYYSAADLIVLPYRTFMSSSGPLSFAFSYQKPFLLSQNMDNYFDSADLRKCLTDSKLERSDIEFKMDIKSFNKQMNGLNSEKLKKLTMFADLAADVRSFKRIGQQYFETIF